MVEAGGVAEGITARTGVLVGTGVFVGTGLLLGKVEMLSGTGADFPVCIGRG